MRLLVAEDEREIGKALKLILERSKYSVDWVDNGTDALEYLLTGSYDGAVLDIMMPGQDGIAVLMALRRAGLSTPVLLLTAKAELSDRVAGLDAGAGDYLPKPFASSELLARVRAMLRRREQFTPDLLTFEDLTLNCSAYELGSTHGVLRLTNKEFQIMELLMRSPHHIFSSEQLMERIWGWDSDTEINVVWTNIAYLRRKLARLKVRAEIRSVRGAGYMLEAIPC